MISSLFGVGGGIIFVPAMLLVLGLTMHRASTNITIDIDADSYCGCLYTLGSGTP